MEKPLIVTNPYNSKRIVYEALGYRVAGNNPHETAGRAPAGNNLHKIAGRAEEEYDNNHGIGFTGPLYPENGSGLPYPVAVALAKVSAVAESLLSPNSPITTTDVVWSNGEEIVNKPKTPEEAVYWWLKNRGRGIYNIAGNATWEGNFVTLTAIFLMPGKVNPKLPMDRLRTLLYSNLDVNTSGGLNLFRALEEGIITHNGKIRVATFQWPPFPIELLEDNRGPIKLNPHQVYQGELSLVPENILPTMGLLYGVEPR